VTDVAVDPAPASSDDRQLTIDDLAAVSGVPSRTIRFYQTKGALPPPRREGRVALYGEHHVERLRVIGEMQDRGLRLSAIVDLLAREHADLSVRQWLGVGAQLNQPWSDDQPQLVSESVLAERLAGRPPGTMAGLVDSGLVERRPGATYLIQSPTLVDIALELQAGGVDTATIIEANEVLQRRLLQAAEDLIAVFADPVLAAVEQDPGAFEQTFETLRTQSTRAVSVLFARQMEAALAKVLATGEVPADARKRRRSR
jgi:DNA-binding transcriptional MerR regulator